MGIFDRIKSAFGDLSAKTDQELSDEYEALRQRYISHHKIDNEHIRIRNEMDRYNSEMTRRLNAKYHRENPNPKPVHREHGWYLSNDD